jgi:cobalt/nickel transport system ATP-binding protein
MDDRPVAVRASKLCHFYPDGTRGIENLNLEVPEGVLAVIVGANGTGKSTLLQCMAGILRPQRGEVHILGELITSSSLKSIRSKLGFVFQNPDDQVFCPTVLEDVSYGPVNMGLEPDAVRRQVGAALAKVRLTGFEMRSPQHLSYGEKKKVALAGVLSMSPRLVLLDEPTSGLDPRSASELIDIVLELRAEGKTIIATTHDLHFAGEAADILLVFGESKTIVAQGPPAAILADSGLLVANNLVHQHVHRHEAENAAHRHPHLHFVHEHGHDPGEGGRHVHEDGHEHSHDHPHEHDHPDGGSGKSR